MPEASSNQGFKLSSLPNHCDFLKCEPIRDDCLRSGKNCLGERASSILANDGLDLDFLP